MSGALGPPVADALGPPMSEDVEKIQLVRQVSKVASGEDTQPVDRFLSPENKINVLMIGTGEYTTGFVNGKASDSDKSAGVVALTMFDLRQRHKVHRLGLCGVNGTKFPAIRAHMKTAIEEVYGLDIDIETFPKDTESNPFSYQQAIDSFQRGDIVIIFTPDDTHYDIAQYAIQHGMHVLITKPAVKYLSQHELLHKAALQQNVLVSIEVHKRFDPIYLDARDKAQALGGFSYLYSYMSQPKHQLETFKNWAGKSSDISYYLNSHHIDFHEWVVGNTSRPVKVIAIASTGVAKDQYRMDCEDTITLTVQWENIKQSNDGSDVVVTSLGTAVYTSSWVAPRSDVHSQQRFFYMGQKGEVNVDQAHRGYNMSVDGSGYRSVNPLFMKYTPSNGKFTGQSGYGYRSFELFVDAVTALNSGKASVSDYDHSLASIATTYRTTAILEAGRKSLDENRPVEICYAISADPDIACKPTALH